MLAVDVLASSIPLALCSVKAAAGNSPEKGESETIRLGVLKMPRQPAEKPPTTKRELERQLRRLRCTIQRNDLNLHLTRPEDWPFDEALIFVRDQVGLCYTIEVPSVNGEAEKPWFELHEINGGVEGTYIDLRRAVKALLAACSAPPLEAITDFINSRSQ